VPAPACSGHGSTSRSGHRRGGDSREPPHSSYSRAPIARPPAMSSSGRGRGTAPDGFDAQSRANAHAAARQGSAGLRYLARLRRSGAALSAVEETSRVPQLSLPRVPVVAGLTSAVRYLVGGRSGQTGGTGVTSLHCRTGLSQWPSAMRWVTGPQQHRPCGSCVPCCAAAPTMARSLNGPGPYGRPGPDFDMAQTATVLHGRLVTGAHGALLRYANAGHLPPLLIGPDGTARYLDRPAPVSLARRRRRGNPGPKPPPSFRSAPDSSTPAAPPELAPNWRCAWRTGSPEPRTTAMPCIACLAATGPQMSTSPPLPGDACLWSRTRCCLAPLKLPPLSIYPTRTCRGRYTEVVETQALPPRCRLPRQLAAPRQLRRPRPCSVDDAPSPLGSFSRRAPGEVPAGLRCAPAFLIPAEGALPVQRPAGVFLSAG